MYPVCIFVGLDPYYMKQVTTAIIQDLRVQRKDGSYAIKLRLTHNKKQKYYPLGVAMLPKDWQATQQSNPRGEAKAQRLHFNQIESEATSIIRSTSNFTFEVFEKQFLQKDAPIQDVSQFFDSYINKLEQENRIKSKVSYECAKNSILSFHKTHKKGRLRLDAISPEWLKKYERWMIDSNKASATVGIYLRSLRAIFNEAIDNGLIDRANSYPFGKKKYVIPAGKNVKKALSKDSIKAIIDYEPVSPAERRAKDLWLFSFMCNGMNFKDIAGLKFSDIDDQHLTFYRSKTHRTSKGNIQPIRVFLIPEAIEIIERHSVEDVNGFIFGIFSKSDTELVRVKKVDQEIKTINKYIGRIATKVGIAKKVTTYTARHSYATRLKQMGAPIEFIKESLGHSDSKTTQSYLDSFDDETKQQFQRALLA